MSSISSVNATNPYSKIYNQVQVSRTQQTQANSMQVPSAFRLRPDQLSISSEGLDALHSSPTTEDTHEDPLQKLVDQGIITQDQLEAIKSELESNKPQGQPPMGPPPGQKPMGPPPGGENMNGSGTNATSDESDILQSLLDSLVENGTIDEDQKTTLQESLLQLGADLISGSKPQH